MISLRQLYRAKEYQRCMSQHLKQFASPFVAAPCENLAWQGPGSNAQDLSQGHIPDSIDMYSKEIHLVRPASPYMRFAITNVIVETTCQAILQASMAKMRGQC